MEAPHRNINRKMGADFLRIGCSATIAGMIVVAGTAMVRGAASHANPILASEQSITRGRSVYLHHCAECHGRSGHGDGSAGRDLNPHPTDLTRPELAEFSDAQLFKKISRGRRPMPSFDRLLKEEDRWHVVNYLRTLSRPPAGADAR